MPNIRVTCPTCQTPLEVDAVHEGQEVECGNCLQVFVATTAQPRPAAPDDGPGRSGRVRGAVSRSARPPRDRDDDEEPDRPRRRERRDDDDEFDYDPRTRRDAGPSGLATASLVLGILGLVPGCFCCWAGFPMSLAATVLGGVALGTPGAKGMGVAGLVLGICGMIFNVIRGAMTGFIF